MRKQDAMKSIPLRRVASSVQLIGKLQPPPLAIDGMTIPAFAAWSRMRLQSLSQYLCNASSHAASRAGDKGCAIFQNHI